MFKKFPFIGQGRPLISVIRLNGVISSGTARSGLSINSLSKNFDQAFKQKGLKAVVLDINSPGGSPVQSSLIYKYIRRLSNEKKIPVISFVQDVAASGGYWLACTGDEIFADSNSIIGSIGVISGGFGFKELIKKIGIERRMYTSGEQKSFLDPFLAEKQSDVDHLKSLQEEIHLEFKNLVRDRRKNKLSKEENKLFTGKFWTGNKALELGLIDGIGDINTVMKSRYGEKVRFRIFDSDKSWIRRKFGLGYASNNRYQWSDHIIDSIESRLLWSRFGL